MVPLECWGDSAPETGLCFPKNIIGKCDLLTFLTLLWTEFRILLVQMKSNCKITVTIEFFVQNGPWNVSNDSIEKFWLVTFLNWPWPWLELNMQILFGQYLHRVLGSIMESFKRTMLILRSRRSITWIRPILTFELDLTRDLILKI